ncbi:MAG: hypothetical protein SGI71_09000 [Verrucomicrobiota bacterium]|nr:hypothetical protein [Verrucomicrobiota bacterium]
MSRIASTKISYMKSGRHNVSGNSLEGSVLAAVLTTIVLISLLLASAVTLTNHTRAMANRATDLTALKNAGLSAMENDFASVYSWHLSTNTLNAPMGISNLTARINSSTLPPDLSTAGSAFKFPTHTAFPLNTQGVPANAPQNFDTRPSNIEYRYMAITHVSKKGSTIPPLKLQREFVYRAQPICNYALFTHGNVLVSNVVGLSVPGPVHANGKITVDGSSASTWAGQVTAVTGFQLALSSNNLAWATNIGFTSVPALASTITDPITVTADISDTNPNNDGSRELIETPILQTNLTSHVDVNASFRLYNQAGLKVIHSTQGTKFFTLDGIEISTNSGAIYTVMTNVFSGKGKIMDHGADLVMATSEVNISGLFDSSGTPIIPATLQTNASFAQNNTLAKSLGVSGKKICTDPLLQGKPFWNGIIYISSSSISNGAVKISNATTLPIGGLSIASDSPVYVAGSFNSAPPKNSSGVPSALIADSVTLLSGAWSATSNDITSKSSRIASSSIYNVSLVTGASTNPTEGPLFGVRLLESWTSASLTLKGSIATLYSSSTFKSPPLITAYDVPLDFKWTMEDYATIGYPLGIPSVKSLSKEQAYQVD